MKTEEDEAFDELAKRQGMWGGGFQAKRAAAADKQREWVDLTDDDADDLFVETQRHMRGHGSREFTRVFTRLINVKLKEKNT